jgi:hypothetical protein
MKKLLFGPTSVTIFAIFYLLTCFAYWQFPVNFAEWSIEGRTMYAFAFITFGFAIISFIYFIIFIK